MFGIESYKNNKDLNDSNDYKYRQKYLKYKQKYLELNQTGGRLPGIYAYLTTEEKANQLVALYNKCKKNEGSDVQFNIDITGELTGTINVTNNIDNAEFGKLVQTKTNEFNTFVITEQVKLAKTIENKKSEYTKLFNEHLIKCNTPKSDDIVNLLNDNAYLIKKDTKKIELIHNTSIMTRFNKEKGTHSKKNSSTISDLKISFTPDIPNIFTTILSLLKISNEHTHPNYTIPTHYVLIEESLTSTKLVGDGIPKLIPQ